MTTTQTQNRITHNTITGSPRITDFTPYMEMKNRCFYADSYKYSHAFQYPKMSSMFDYMSSRGGTYPATIFVGAQPISKMFARPIQQWEVDEAFEDAQAHGVPFDVEGWDYIVQTLGGNIPVRIRSIEEGKLIPVNNVLMTFESTDTKVPWIAGWLETVYMKAWYPTTVATKSYYTKQILLAYAKETQDEPNVDFQFHNFGDRGASSIESAALAGFAHLTQFMGTDNFNSLRYVRNNYKTKMAGFSIKASEHSTTTANADGSTEKEMDFIMRHYESAKGDILVAAVLDSYDYEHAVRTICKKDGKFQEKINSDEYPIFVMRPDSGNPKDVISITLDIMEDEEVPYIVNNRGFKVFNKMRIIYGDGINMKSIMEMLDVLVERGYSSENLNFGSGGWLVQGN